MYIVQYFKYEKDNVIGVSVEVPDGATILETMDVLFAEEGYDLIRISDEENMGNSVWLRDGDVQENYKEEEQEKPQEEQEIDNG